jgi:DNA (cytosine-5)-methyltransferase 1
VDIDPQPDYPFEFHQANALTYPMSGFDLIHASPPCQDYTPMSNRHGSDQPRLIQTIRNRLRLLTPAQPYVIENVVGSGGDLENPIILTGEMFGLTTSRRRLFELGEWWTFQPPIPPRQADAVAVYGEPNGRRLTTRQDGSELRAWSSVAEGREALGIDWTDNWHSIREAIPPAYTEWIGSAFLECYSSV